MSYVADSPSASGRVRDPSYPPHIWDGYEGSRTTRIYKDDMRGPAGSLFFFLFPVRSLTARVRRRMRNHLRGPIVDALRSSPMSSIVPSINVRTVLSRHCVPYNTVHQTSTHPNFRKPEEHLGGMRGRPYNRHVGSNTVSPHKNPTRSPAFLTQFLHPLARPPPLHASAHRLSYASLPPLVRPQVNMPLTSSMVETTPSKCLAKCHCKIY